MITAIEAISAFVASFYGAQVAGAFLHELGHLVGAWMVGWQPYSFSLGVGTRRARFRLGGVDVALGIIPLGGLARAAPTGPAHFKTKLLLFVAAGPAATAVALAILCRLMADGPQPDGSLLREYILPGALLNQAVMLLFSLWPHWTRIDGQRYPSDGLQLRIAPWLSRAESRAALIACVSEHAHWQLSHQRLEEVRSIVGLLAEIDASAPAWIPAQRVYRLLTNQRTAEAHAEWEALEKRPDNFGSRKAEALDALACLPLFHGLSALIPRALCAIEQAIALEPDQITFKGTKGSLLIESGQTEAGIALLKEVCQKSESENDQAICSYYLALAQSRLGNAPEALRRLQEAKHKYPQCIVAPRVGSMISTTGRPLTRTA